MKRKKTKRGHRLCGHVNPERYDLVIKPDMEAFIFEGEESIKINLDKSEKNITLHSKDLDIYSAEIVQNKEKIFALKTSYDKNSETVTFLFPKNILKGKAVLKLFFRGAITDKLAGFYRSRFSHNGKEEHLATTQFEPTYARRAFPCFDEPKQKAVFNVSLIVPENLEAISNTMPSSIKEHKAGYKVVKFSPTPKMSTYLLAFLIGEFEYVEGYTKEGVHVRICVTPGKKSQAKFALECTVKMLSFYTKYFGIPYPMKNMDMIAVPDFNVGAMENWGAITYRESAILFDEENSSAQNKQRVAIVIAHELAHQWFGNLVTMEWWTHLWLNEGFASYIEYLATDHVFPKWDMWTQFASDDLGVALRLDALLNTHPIEVEVGHTDEISEIFDVVSYSKGASIIRMLAEYLGPENFRKGLSYYLKKHSYKNASTIHLWEAFEKISKKPVSKIMQNWTKKAGYPVVEANILKDKLQLRQSRFFSSIISEKKAKDKTVWQIPVSLNADKKISKEILSKKVSYFNIPSGRWLKVNAKGSGFFRTKYSKEMLSALSLPVKSKALSPIDRLGIIGDLFALNSACDETPDLVLDFAKNYIKEDDYVVWSEVSSGLAKIYSLLYSDAGVQKASTRKTIQNYEKFCRAFFVDIGKNLGWYPKKKESYTDGLLRTLVLFELGKYGDKDTIKKAMKIFKSKKVPVDLRGAVYNIIAKNGGKKEFSIFEEMYKKTDVQHEKNRIGSAMTSFKQKEMINKALLFAISKNVRTQDSIHMIAQAFANPSARAQAWIFIKKNWKYLLDTYGEASHMLPAIVSMLGVFSSKKMIKEIKGFFKKNSAPGSARTIRQSLEKIEANIAWKKLYSKKIEKWLEENK